MFCRRDRDVFISLSRLSTATTTWPLTSCPWFRTTGSWLTCLYSARSRWWIIYRFANVKSCGFLILQKEYSFSVLISEYYISDFQHSYYNSKKFEFTSSKIRSVSCFVRVFREGDVIYMTEKALYSLLSYLSYLHCEFYTTGLTEKVNFGYLQTVRGIIRI